MNKKSAILNFRLRRFHRHELAIYEISPAPMLRYIFFEIG